MFQHDTESRLLLARERAHLLASEMRAGAGPGPRALVRPLRRGRVVEGRRIRETDAVSAGVRAI